MYSSFCIYNCVRETCPFAIAVLCAEEEKERVLQAIAESRQWKPAEELDPVELDSELAALLHSVCPDDILAAAAIAKLWTEGPVSGGVIGAPHSDSESANARVEEIAPSLWSWAYSGNCGFVMYSGRKDAYNAVDVLYTCISSGKDPWPEFFRFYKSNPNIISFIYASDASGRTGRLCAGNRLDVQEIEI